DAGIDAVIVAREAHVVPHRLGLAEARKADRVGPLECAEPRREGGRLVEIDPGHLGPADLEDERLLDAQRAIAGGGRGVAGSGFAGAGGAALAVQRGRAPPKGTTSPPAPPLPACGRGIAGERWSKRHDRVI